MKRKQLQWMAVVLAAALLAGGLTGCGASQSGSASASSKASSVASSAVESVASQPKSETTTTAKLPQIGIAWVMDYGKDDFPEDVQVYLDAVRKAGGEPVLLEQVKDEASAKQQLDKVDAVIMTGGEDIDPELYGAKPDAKLEEVNKARDTSDYWMIRAALNENVPMLATCRGMQMLNVVCGGTLYQDIPTQYKTKLTHRSADQVDFAYHDITVEEGSLLADIMGAGTHEVNSWHHQCVDKVGEGLTVMATAPDGIVEGLTYPACSYVVGVQFHPEWHVAEGDDSFLVFFTDLVKHAA